MLLGIVSLLLWHHYRNAGNLDNQLIEELNGNRSLARYLQDAVKGNRGLARRLLAQVRNKYPGKSDRWYVEKMIYDLERDRAGSRPYSSRYVSAREMRENIFLFTAVLSLVSAFSSFLKVLFRDR
jgi:hypothetical protein